MDKDKLNKLSKKELIEMIHVFEEKIAVTDECRSLLRLDYVGSRQSL